MFWGIGISRRDGNASDGIHLLWNPTGQAAHSLHGFDIQRRVGQTQRPVSCYTLTPTDLALLHQNWRLATRIGRLALRRGPCPLAEELVDQAHSDAPPECLDFRRLLPGPRPNPFWQDGVLITVWLANGSLAPNLAVGRAPEHGLDAGSRLEIALPEPAKVVQLALVVHGEAVVEVLDPKGARVAVRRVAAAAGPRNLVFTAAEIARLRVTGSEITALEVCSSSQPAPEPRPPQAEAPSASCFVYSVDLPSAQAHVSVRAGGVPSMLALALREGKVVDTRPVTAAPSPLTANFQGLADRVVLYVPNRLTGLTICGAANDESDWANVPFIARGIQLPLRTLDPALARALDEAQKAEKRLIAGESFPADAFARVAAILDDCVGVSRDQPLSAVTLSRTRDRDAFTEIPTWRFAMSLMADPRWRRMLGFGYFDAGSGLTAGTAYEYRISARFRRRDLEETAHGFHTVPAGTTLPLVFRFGALLCQTEGSARVEILSPPAAHALEATVIKGVAIGPTAPAGNKLRLDFAAPVARVVLDLAPRPGDALAYQAATAELIPGFGGGTTLSGNLTIGPRVDMSFPQRISSLTLTGSGFLLGIRDVASPPGTRPDDELQFAEVTPPVVYQSTPPPAPPLQVGTAHLQTPPLLGAAILSTRTPPHFPGFYVRWQPAPPVGTPIVSWPPDLPAFPPFDSVGFYVERRRVDTLGAFAPVGMPDELIYGNRSARRDPLSLAPGVDLDAVFPEHSTPVPPVSLFVQLEDVLIDANGQGPPPGSLHQYRVSSVDVLGRRSLPALGSVVRLEKRLPPPMPVGPVLANDSPEPLPPGVLVAPAGVRARVVLAEDPDLSQADRDRLGHSRNAVVLEWGWRKSVEQVNDPFASEFRLYLQPDPPDRVRLTLSGAPVLIPGGYRIPAVASHALQKDELVDRFLHAGYPFRVLANDAGTAVQIDLEKPKLGSAVPQAASLTVAREPTGGLQRPSALGQRVDVRPIGDTSPYWFPDCLTLDADHPTARIWVGVSAADGEIYVADELPATALNGGLPGNEGRIAVAEVTARYRGQPRLTVPPPAPPPAPGLPDLADVLLNEPVVDSVACLLDLPTLTPGLLPVPTRVVLERMGLDALLLRTRADGGAIVVDLDDGTTLRYTLTGGTDQADFTAQLQAGEPMRVQSKFLLDLARRALRGLDTLFTASPIGVVPYASVIDALPEKAERYVHRLRLVDNAGHISNEAALLPQVVRVPSLRAPAPPQLTVEDGDADGLIAQLSFRAAFDLQWAVVFSHTDDWSEKSDDAQLRPQLLRQPNLPARYPDVGIRLRLADGTILAPTAKALVPVAPADGPAQSLSIDFTPGFEKRVGVWAILITRDGIPSRVAGPQMAVTARAPLTPPALSVRITTEGDLASWPNQFAPGDLSLERSDDGVSWSRVSPWIPARDSSLADPATTLTIPTVGPARRYRLVLRDTTGRTFVGSDVVPR
jgi:hypothetical protein